MDDRRKGVIHSEMPEQTEGMMRGFQLWLNLPKKRKMIDPYYKILANKIPNISIGGMDIKIISGLFNNIKGPGKSHTGFLYLDVSVNELSNINLKLMMIGILLIRCL